MNNMTTVNNAEPMQCLTVTDVQRQVGVIATLIREIMQKDVHYGIIPGTKQQTLFKAGAEKIASTFRLAPDYVVEDLSTDDMSRYRITCRLMSSSGVFVGSGLGEASTNEQKYKWRNAICKEEFEATDPSRRRVKWFKGYNGKPAAGRNQVRQEHDDMSNTVLKMASKRALVAAILTATAASDIFTQDLEDLPDEVRDELVADASSSRSKGADKKSSVQQPASKSGQAENNARRASPSQGQGAGAERNDTGAAADNNADGMLRPNQVAAIKSKCEALNVEQDHLLSAFGVNTLEVLPLSKFREALAWIGDNAK